MKATEKECKHLSEWKYIIELPPMATPRPQSRRLKDGRTITYYSTQYTEYMYNVQKMLVEDGAYNENFYNVLNAEMGVRAEIIFYVQAPKSQKKIKNVMRTSAPDIDNLVKACLDSIFRGLDVKDSRVCMLATAKFQELHRPRTEIRLIGVE